jgi:hypothetical protein
MICGACFRPSLRSPAKAALALCATGNAPGFARKDKGIDYPHRIVFIDRLVKSLRK